MNSDYVISRFKQEATRPLEFHEIMSLLGIYGEEGEKQLELVLSDLTATGQLVKTRKLRYGLPEQLNLFVGRIKKNKKGFGFLISEDPDKEDLFIPSGDMNGAMNQDQVVVRIRKPAFVKEKTGAQFRAEGEVIRILTRHKESFVGTLSMRKNFAFVRPDDVLFGSDIFVPLDDSISAKDGDKVLIQITSWPDGKQSAEGKVERIIGHQDDIGMDILSIVLRHGLSEDFPDKIRQIAKALPQVVSEEEASRRYDLRSRMLVTIDGADSKDLDDAVFVERLDNGNYILIVAIADVAEYVEEDRPLDFEAYRRGTSVYLVDRVLPMLPEELSNGICSLNAGEDRLALATFMEIDANGNVVTAEIFESVINVAYRMTYDDVNKILAKDPEVTNQYNMLTDMFEDMRALRDILHEKRIRRGAIEFNIPESNVRLNDKGEPVEIYVRNRGVAETIIEEFMIVTNEMVADRYLWLKTPFIYRVHEKPTRESLDNVADYLGVLGYHFPKKDDIQSTDYQKILEKIKDDDVANSINMVMLRSMNHAYYSSECKGHFGLASRHYTHFTSPIRRYSDLAIHRIIKEMIRNNNRLSIKQREALEERVVRYSEQASNTERIAEEAERDSVDLKKVEYMQRHVGEIFSARIVSITGFGMFVQLDNLVEGLVHISTLVDDFYQFDAKAIRLVGENTKKTYKLGQILEVQLTKVNVAESKLDFEIVAGVGEETTETLNVSQKKKQKKSRPKKHKKG